MSTTTTKDAPRVIAPEEPLTEAVMERAKHEVRVALDKQEKVTVRLQKEGKGQPNFETVQINGYTYQVMRGVDALVPKQVRDILVEAELY